jgi:hypothetical protein
VFERVRSQLGMSLDEQNEAEPLLAVAVGLAMGRRS